MDWSALSTLEPAEGAEKLAGLTEQMSDFIDAHPETKPKLIDIFERNLESSIDTETYTPIWYGIASLFGIGEDAPRIFTWLSAPDQQERLNALAARCKPQFAQLLRSIFALYGQELQNAYRRWREYPDNWEAMHRQVYVDNERNQARIDIKIVKYNQESLDLTLDARSLLLMISRLMGSLALAAGGPFADAELNELREQSDAFWEAIGAVRNEQPPVAESETAQAVEG